MPVGWLLTPVPCQDLKVSSVLQCLEASATDDPYTQALLTYVLGLVGCGAQQQARLQSLAQHSVSAGTTWWIVAPPGSAALCLGHPIPPPVPRDPRSRGAELPPPSLPEEQLYWWRKGKALPPSQPSWAAAAPAEVEMTLPSVPAMAEPQGGVGVCPPPGRPQTQGAAPAPTVPRGGGGSGCWRPPCTPQAPSLRRGRTSLCSEGVARYSAGSPGVMQEG